MTDDLNQTIKNRYPDLPRNKIGKVRNAIIDMVGARLLAGEQLAFTRRGSPPESLEISVFDWSVAKDNVRWHESARTEGSLKIHVPIDSFAPMEEFNRKVIAVIWAVDFLYTILELARSNSRDVREEFIEFLNSESEYIGVSRAHILDLQVAEMQNFTRLAHIEPLRIISIHYGSPVIADFLGVAQSLAIIRDIIKDITWRGKHEKKTAELDLKSKQVEIQKARLDYEKAAIDIATQRIELDKASVELASKKLALYREARDLELSISEQNVVAVAMSPKIRLLSENQVELRD